MAQDNSIKIKRDVGSEFSESAEVECYKIFRDLQKVYGCTYMSYYETDTAKKEDIVGFFSNPDWGDTYTAEGMISHCALVRDAKNLLGHSPNKNRIYTWDMAISQNAKEKSVRDARKDFGIFHGLSLSIKQGDTFKFFGVASEESNKNFIRSILNDIDRFKKYVVHARSLAQNSVKHS